MELKINSNTRARTWRVHRELQWEGSSVEHTGSAWQCMVTLDVLCLVVDRGTLGKRKGLRGGNDLECL